MVLQPRKFKYKLRQKNRITSITKRSINKGMSYGQVGLILLRPLRINSRKIFRIRLFIKRAARRSDNTYRKVWLNVFPHLPLTKKIVGSRMGKGKGKLSAWFGYLNSGHIFIEYRNLRNGRAFYYLRQSSLKIKGKHRLIKSATIHGVGTGLLGVGHTHFQLFW